jgi:tRNA modification GTPase
MPDQSTIFALSSGRGKAGVAVIRVSGPSAASVLDRMAPPRPPVRRAALRRIVDPVRNDLLDQALVLFFQGPASETGEDIAELHLHGSPAVVRATLDAMSQLPDCRLAEPGEFARRAFLNGKIDLTAAEGLADLIDAETDAQRRQALAQAGGAFARLCDAWRERVLEARAMAEAAIDFSDEGDVASDAMQRARAVAGTMLAEVRERLSDANRGEIVRDGFRIVLAGPPNAGKSSLVNALARRDVAIVTAEPGTTRDVIEVHLDLAGYAVVVADTAGLREAEGLVEREGIRRSLERAQCADLVIWLVDAENAIWSPPRDLAAGGSRVMTVLNKTDLATSPAPAGVLAISTLTGAGLALLIESLSSLVADRLEGTSELVAPTRTRHRAALEACLAALSRAVTEPSPAPELVAEDLRIASDALGRITGRVDAEDVLGFIFGRFCIGK